MAGDDDTKIVTDSERPKPPAAGNGRPKGAVNKVTKALKEMILEALDRKGGVDYLERQADENATAFLTLVGKVLPTQLTGKDDGPIEFANVTEDIEAVDKMLGSLVSRTPEQPIATLQ